MILRGDRLVGDLIPRAVGDAQGRCVPDVLDLAVRCRSVRSSDVRTAALRLDEPVLIVRTVRSGMAGRSVPREGPNNPATSSATKNGSSDAGPSAPVSTVTGIAPSERAAASLQLRDLSLADGEGRVRDSVALLGAALDAVSGDGVVQFGPNDCRWNRQDVGDLAEAHALLVFEEGGIHNGRLPTFECGLRRSNNRS